MKNFFLGILITLMIIGGGVFVYLYSQNKTNPKTETNIPVVTPTITIIPTEKITPTTDESGLIKSALFKKNNWKNTDDINVVVSTNDGKYASGTVNSQGGGGYFYAVKDNSVWIIVADGNGLIDCSSLTKYPDYPKTLIPECYDFTNDKSIKR